MAQYRYAKVPEQGERITCQDGCLQVPDFPIIPYIEGDGTGPDIWRASERVINAAITKAYGDQRRIAWMEVYAGEKAKTLFDTWLPEETIEAFKEFRVGIKGPLTTPIGGGFRSLNVTLRQVMDLFACVRPVRYYEGVPSPVKEPQKVNMIIFRENTEDVYAGLEWQAGSEAAQKAVDFFRNELGVTLLQDGTAIGLKPMTEKGCKRLIRKAIQYAIDHKRASVTIVHKGNIMKYTEGAFRDWGYQLAKDEFRDVIVTEAELWDEFNGRVPAGKIVIKDRIADSMFQQGLLRPEEYDVLATTNLNGDYLSDALAAQVGGLGIAPGGNLSDEYAVFEATHGTAPKYANLDKINPGSVILSGVMMLEHLGWQEAADKITAGLAKTIQDKVVTYDLARQIAGAQEVKTSVFAQAIIDRM